MIKKQLKSHYKIEIFDFEQKMEEEVENKLLDKVEMMGMSFGQTLESIDFNYLKTMGIYNNNKQMWQDLVNSKYESIKTKIKNGELK